MADFAELGLRFVPVNDAAATKALSDVATASDRAEIASKKLTATQESAARTQRAVAEANRVNTSALGQMAQAIAAADAAQRAAVASTQKLGAAVQASAAQAKAASASFTTFYDAADRDFSTQYVRQAGKVAAASKLTAQETLNLSRQFADIGVTAAMGMNPLMILVQQGPQIADVFQTAAHRGMGFNAVLASMWAMLAPIVAFLAPFIAGAAALAVVIGGPLLLATKELNDGNKDLAENLGLTEDQLKKVKNEGITAGDVLKGTFIAAADALKQAFAPQLEWLSNAFSATYQFILKATLGAVEGIVKTFGGAIGLLTGLWKNFPAIVGDAVVSGANLALAAVEKLVNGAIGLLNKLIGQANALSAKVGGPQFAALANASVGRIANGNAGAMTDLRASQARGEAAAVTALAGAYRAVEASILKVAAARIREEAGTAKATKALKEAKAAKETLDRTQPIGATMSKAVDLNEVKATKLPKIAGDLKTIHDEAYRAKDAMEEFYKAANEAGSGVDQMFNGLKNRDWMSAVSGLMRAAKAIKEAFGKGGTTGGKVGAIAGVADVVGQAIGGTAGSTLSGAAGGAMLGFQFGGLPGAAIGAVVGGIAGFLSGNSAKKKAKEEEEAARAAAAAKRAADILTQRRQIELSIIEASGNAVAYLAAQRAAEMEGIDESNLALARQMYDAQDAKRRKDEREALELRVMDALGDATGILAYRRAQEVKAVDASNRALLTYVHLQEDLAVKVADARNALAEAYARESSALEATKERFTGLAKTLRDFIDGLGRSSSGAASYAAARRSFLSVSSSASTGDADAMGALPGVAQTFLDASRSNSRTLQEYNRDIATIRNALKAAEESAKYQADAADLQLEALKASVAGLGILNESTLSVRDAILGLQAALAAQTAAVAAFATQQANNPAATPAPYSGGPNWESYSLKHPDVVAEYERNMASEKGRAYLQQLGIGNQLQFNQWHWNTFGKAAGWENFATGGSFTVGGSGGPDSQNFGPINLSPGEVVNVRRPGAANDEDMAGALSALAAEVAALRQDVRAGNANTKKTADILTRVTPNGDTLLTEAA